MRWIFALLLLAACTPAATIDPNTQIAQWIRSPQVVVFRADIEGGESAFSARNAIPHCTIYGDNRVVWANEAGPFQIQVLEDRLTDSTIDQFVQYLTVYERIYTYPGHDTDEDLALDTVTINIGGQEHRADSLSGWDAEWFTRALSACKALSQAPVLVAPSSGWLSTQPTEFSTQYPVATWDNVAAGVSLSGLVGKAPRWFSGEAASALWNTIHSLPSNLIFNEAGSYYQVALQVPGVTRYAPPAPG